MGKAKRGRQRFKICYDKESSGHGSEREAEATDDFQFLAHTHRLIHVPRTDRRKTGKNTCGEKTEMPMEHLNECHNIHSCMWSGLQVSWRLKFWVCLYVDAT